MNKQGISLVFSHEKQRELHKTPANMLNNNPIKTINKPILSFSI